MVARRQARRCHTAKFLTATSDVKSGTYVADMQLTPINFASVPGDDPSLVSHSATMTHASMSLTARREAGLSDSLLRLSVGLENEADLLDDLARGLDAAQRRE